MREITETFAYRVSRVSKSSETFLKLDNTRAGAPDLIARFVKTARARLTETFVNFVHRFAERLGYLAHPHVR